MSFLPVRAEMVNIGILHTSKLTSFVFHPEEGNYSIFTEHGKLMDIDKGEILEVSLKNNQISIKSLDKDYGTFKKVRFIGISGTNSFKIKLPYNNKIKVYEDNLFVNLHNYYNYFQLINNIEIDHYISGVVESEVGRSPPPEYFKLQAIICRTYALKNIDRHTAEGFSLCDKVHCQAYHGKPKSLLIREASLETNGIVIVDSDINLITATFYSNCGGVTANSEEVWRQDLYYLRSVRDTFCLNENNSVWSKTISKTNWEAYLKQHNCSEDALSSECSVEYFQNGREQFYWKDDVKIPFVKIRQDFNLKSALFDVEDEGSHVTLKGRGFGHGVGLCQEGAMRMAKLGYNYIDILHYYYEDVHMINLESLAFFKADF
ncbi:MAG: SpoIID/LytB domain-containing protein [Flavobacteriales bacterium]|nr:SpoIID/LytB domain-containing protein [Flavobacteriales bacterium]